MYIYIAFRENAGKQEMYEEHLTPESPEKYPGPK
jgi:hypothetical protein